MAQAKKGLGRGLSALIPTDMDFLAEVARGDFSVLASADAGEEVGREPVVSRETASGSGSSATSTAGVGSVGSRSVSAESEGRAASTINSSTSSGTHSVADAGVTPEVAAPAGATPQERAGEAEQWSTSRLDYAAASGVEPGGWRNTGRDVLSAVQWVAPSAIVANPYQPRRSFDQSELDSLRDSIREHGVLQPILVRPIAMGWDFSLDAEQTPGVHFQLIAGERRWRASLAAELGRVPVIVREVSDQQALELAIIENVQRHDISAMDAATAYKRLAREFGLSQESIARRVGKSRPSIANTMRLLDLPPEAQQAIQDGAISEGHGRAILLAPGDPARRAALRAVLRGKLSVREAEAMAGRIARQAQRDQNDVAAGSDVLTRGEGLSQHTGQATGAPLSSEAASPKRAVGTAIGAAVGTGARPSLEAGALSGEEHPVPEHEDRDLEERLQRALSCRVQVKRRRTGGQIILSASDDDQLERIAQALSK